MKKYFLFFIFQTFLFANSSVLIINSYHKGYEFSDSIINGIEKTFYPHSNIDVNVLYMDSKRVSSKEYYNNLEKLYKVQLKNRKYDLIIAVDRFAYDFVLDIYSSFFTNEPILTVGIENFSPEKAARYGVANRVSALIEKRDLKGNVDIIRTIFPIMKKLYIINDISLNATHTEPLIYDLIEKFDGIFELVYLKEDNLEKLKEKFSKKEEFSAALFIRFYKNKNGELNKNQEIAKFIKNAKIPIFVTDSLFIKKGATGGKVVDLFRFGKTSGIMALGILNGTKPRVEIYDDLNYIFDSTKLSEFTLPVDALKVPVELVNKRKTFYDRHTGFINFVFTTSPFLLFLIIGLFHNIYMRKQVEKDLRRRIEFDETLLNAIESPIFWQDSNGVIVDSNTTFCKLLNIDCSELYGKKLTDFIDNANVKEVLKVLEKYKQNEKENYEFSYVNENKRKIIYLVKKENFYDEKSKSEGSVTIFTDITKEKEIALEKQKNRQFVIQQSKLAEIGEIFSSIAHQWKSPLVEITAIAQELFYTKSCKDEKEDDSFVKDIMNQVTYMTDTINDFQNFIMPSNKKVLFNIEDAIKSMLLIVHHNMKYNSIKISIEIENNTNLKVFGYKNEFMQSFLNIVNNAKDALLSQDYKNRKIDIKLHNEAKELIITIQDNAGGISEKNLENIFEPYFTTKEEGHGIGLYMSKVIIEDKMNGKISVKNKDNGALFTIRLRQDENFNS
ncbi:ATP-binding protein [Arcobacter sp. CECT 8983]|uniref:sensor histidine kinase n=1 Tax=Arcobacter sp. CECT 8983 TaxID=2044508 RepID=UPI00100B6B65|nr:ABC transporter substrate binding protein [Arcobacter sp. CECT 8983]RXJ91239.1 ATP-binding protein [Arcobacter sp. CECT 8983]